MTKLKAGCRYRFIIAHDFYPIGKSYNETDEFEIGDEIFVNYQDNEETIIYSSKYDKKYSLGCLPWDEIFELVAPNYNKYWAQLNE